MPWADARKRVEGPTLDVLISWRDDVDDDTNVMRDVLREVIIISDNEDDEEDDANAVSGQAMTSRQQHHRETSVEIVSVNDKVQTHQLDLNMEPPLSEGERPIQYIPRQNPLGLQRPSDVLREERRGAQRHSRWQQALSRKRNEQPACISLTSFEKPVPEPVYLDPVQIESMYRPRESRMPLPAPTHPAYDNHNDVQSNNSQYYVPAQRVDHLLSRATGSQRSDLVPSDNPMQQVSFLWNGRSHQTIDLKVGQFPLKRR